MKLPFRSSGSVECSRGFCQILLAEEDFAAADVRRMRELHTKGVASEQSIDEAERKHRTAVAALDLTGTSAPDVAVTSLGSASVTQPTTTSAITAAILASMSALCRAYWVLRSMKSIGRMHSGAFMGWLRFR